jgi:putative NADPH-quinone reductase
MADERQGPLVLAVLGSARPRSNTDVLMQGVLSGATAAGATADTLRLRDLHFEPCRACHGCDLTGRCVVEDDMRRIYSRLRSAQHLVLASPIQFSAVSAQTKAMIDRTQCCWVKTYRLRESVAEASGERRGLFIATCGGPDSRVFEWAKPPVRAFFNSTGFRYWGDLFEPRTDDPPPVSERGDLLHRAGELGRRLVTAP